MNTKSIILPLLILAVSISIFLYICNQSGFVQDDAYITFRYVRNFLNGEGLVFNSGEYVEGYTSFLWVLILALVSFLNLNISNVAQILSVSFGIAGILLSFIVSRGMKISYKPGSISNSFSYFDLIPPFLLAVTGAFSYWSVSGMETSLFVFLVLLGFNFYLKDELRDSANYKFIFSFLLASLARPEGFFIFTLVLLHQLIFSDSLLDKPKRNFIIKEATLFLTPFTLYILFRLLYYGYPLPNTFYAKTGFSQFYLDRGIKYFFDFINAYLFYGVLLIIPLLLLKITALKRIVLLFYFIIIAYIISVIIIGGDVLPMHRLFLPVLPLIYILFGKSLEYLHSLYKPNNLVKKNISVLIIIIIISLGIYNHKKEESKLNLVYRTEIGLVTKMKVYAEWIKEQQEIEGQRLTIAASTIGAISYFSEANVIDLLGLTNEFIAHNPKELTGLTEAAPSTWRENHYNADYVLTLKPAYIIFPAGAKPSGFPESAVFVNDRFITEYFIQLIYSEELKQLLPVFTRRIDEQIETAKIKYNSIPCDEKFIPHYIKANNLLLAFIQNKDRSLVQRIVELCDAAVEMCPKRKYDFYTLLGMTYYHDQQMQKAKSYLSQSAKYDEMNSINHFYLKNIYAAEKDTTNMLLHLRKLKEYSPFSLPQLLN